MVKSKEHFKVLEQWGGGPKFVFVFVFPGPNWENLPIAIASTISGEVTET